jgi:hypothetical protein
MDNFQYGPQDPNYLGPDYGSRLPDRVMAAEYNLAVQRGDGGQAWAVLARMIGTFLFRRAR